MFNSARLTLARKRKKMSCKELAACIDVSPVTITRLETGRNEPEEETLDNLSRALGFPREFFLGSDIDELDVTAASFRSLTGMTAKERDGALSAGSIAYLLADWVDEQFDLPKVDIKSFGAEFDPAGAARTLREMWALGERPIGSMIKLLESKGIRVFSLAESSRNVDAFSCWRNNIPYIFLNTLKSAEHSRFDAAHELGHLVLHRHGGPHQKTAEIDANNFASSFLMPSSEVLAAFPFVSSIDQLIKEKKRWGVSLSALTYRLHKLGSLTDWQYRNFCIQINRRGFRTAEPGGLEREVSVVWNKVFTELWRDGVTKSHIARKLFIPLDELEGLVFGLLAAKDQAGSNRPASKPDLKVLKF